MQLKFVLGLRQRKQSQSEAADGGVTDDKEEKMYVWRLSMRYDLQNQGHLEVAMAFDLKHTRVKPLFDHGTARFKSIDEFYSSQEDEESVPSIVFDTNTAFDWGLLALISAYQVCEVCNRSVYARTDI